MKTFTNGLEEMAENPPAVQMERGCLIRRLRGLGIQPIVTHLALTQFYWDLLRMAEKGGN